MAWACEIAIKRQDPIGRRRLKPKHLAKLALAANGMEIRRWKLHEEAVKVPARKWPWLMPLAKVAILIFSGGVLLHPHPCSGPLAVTGGMQTYLGICAKQSGEDVNVSAVRGEFPDR
ncbi:MAG: hypothetical protein ACFCUT_03730 [Kiloniellaceae bacterium]